MAAVGIRVNRRVRFEFHQQVINSFTKSPEGMVSRWVHRLVLETLVVATAQTKFGTSLSRWKSAPTRLKLWQSYGEGPHRFTNTKVTWRLGNSAPHAKFVFLGTGPVITSKRGRKMPVGKSQLGIGKAHVPEAMLGQIRFRRRVRGQRGHNYPMEALRFVLAKGLIG